MGTSVRESLVQVAKATNDPIGGLGTLSRVGIQFTQDQKDMAKQLVETGDVMGAQRIILDELAKQFGGAARAARNTLPGALVAIKSVSGDLQEALGEGLRPEIRGLIEDMILGVKGSEDLATALGVTLGDQLKAIKPLIDDIGGSIQLFIRLNEGSAVSSSRWAGSLLALVPGLQALVEVLALDLKVASELAAINALLDSTIEDQEESVDNLLEGMRKLLDARRDQFKASEDQADAAEEEAEAIKEVASAYQQLQAQLLEAEGIVDLMERTGVSAADAATAVAVLLSEDNKASEEQVLALVEALNAAREAAERLSLQELLEIGARDIRTARFEPSPAFERAQELIAELEGLQEMTVTPNMEGLIVELERASQEFGKDMSDVMRRAGQLLLHFVQQAADTFTAGLGGQQQTGPLGGQSAGTFAQEGADIGNAIGGLFGPGWAVFGQVVGGILGDFIKKGADDASAELVLVAGELKARVIWAEGALTETFGPLAQAFADSIQGVLDSIGGTIQALPENFNIEFRSGQWIKVWGRIFDATEEGIQEGLAFAVIQLLTQADVSGVEPEVQQALESFVGNTLEGFEEAMALAMRLAEGRIGPEATRVRQALEQAFADIEAGVSAGIDIQGGIANIQRFRDQLLGLEQDLGAQKAAEIDAYNAAIDMEILRIQVLGLELQAMEANLQGRLGGVQELAEIVGVEADLNVQRIESMAAVAQATAGAIQAEGARVAAMAAATQVTVEMATGTAEVLARVAGVLADLEALRITGAERAAAIALAAAGRARRAGGGGQSEADRLAEAREREAEAIRETNLEIIRAASFGSQYHEQLANINRDFEAQLEILGPLTLDHEDYANALRAQGILVEQLT
ncbi:MAG: hypothetical protein O7A04_07630, partial [Acidobacteria bacterium]|nr:hypothetical protein [Acidobacteriota bacterium]